MKKSTLILTCIALVFISCKTTGMDEEEVTKLESSSDKKNISSVQENPESSSSEKNSSEESSSSSSQSSSSPEYSSEEEAAYSSSISIYEPKDQIILGGDDNDIYYPGNEKFTEFELSGFVKRWEDSLSTFGLDVDAASYTFARSRVLNYSMIPDSQEVRTEEFLNYFDYNYEEPTAGVFGITTEFTRSPFRDSLNILKIGLKAHTPALEQVPWNLTFLIDVSGSMSGRLDLVKQSLHILVDNMKEGDLISITTYAGKVSTVLEPISLRDSDRETIKGMISDLTAGGSTAMGDGLTNAYQVNQSAFLSHGANRVIVCSDGDANVGAVGGNALLELIQDYVDQGIMLSTLGFGLGNYQDATMEKLANSGNGNYYYIDGIDEAERIFTDKIASTIEAVAIDAKIQVQFNQPIAMYRLLGYENRDIADTLFHADTTDAGELGPGHTVTALYEFNYDSIAYSDPVVTVHLKYKDKDGNNIEQLFESEIDYNFKDHSNLSNDTKLSILVGEYADILRRTPHVSTTLPELWSLAQDWQVNTNEQRNEFYQILEKAATLSP